MKPHVVFVDVDDTLVRSVGTKRIPMPAVVEQVRRLHAAGATLFLWSSGGADYCRNTAHELGLTECFSGFLPKPTGYIDDQPVQEWRDCQHFYPMQAAEA
jgi:hydroxymethylpyrimidine pyrophosphatase-like HAD family hydrolase